MAIKYTNLFHSKAFQSFPKSVILGMQMYVSSGNPASYVIILEGNGGLEGKSSYMFTFLSLKNIHTVTMPLKWQRKALQ
jgi:hypothetical protein